MSSEIKFISLKAIKTSFENGVNSFLELYNIQHNKNIISSSLSNFGQRVIHEGDHNKIHTTEITTKEVEKANKVKALLGRTQSDEELKDIFNSFGDKIINIAFKDDRSYLTSHYSFIVLSILHQAVVFDLSRDKSVLLDNFYKMEELIMTYYLTPDTRHKTVMKNLFKYIADALKRLKYDENSVMLSHDEINYLEIENTSDTEKLWAYLCSKDSFKDIEDIIGSDKVKYYKNLAKELKKYNRNNNINFDTDIKISQQTVSKVKDCFNTITKTLKINEAISNALVAYNLKFEQQTSNPSVEKKVMKYIASKANDYSSLKYRTDVSNTLTSGVSATTLKSLENLFPPIEVGLLSYGILTTLVGILTESKGYGIINRHGITGQIRTCLLKNYINLISTFIRNNYLYLFRKERYKIDDSMQINSTFVKNFCEKFQQNYENSINVLPNKDKKGSLYFYLSMYADPTNNSQPDIKKMQQWARSKISWINNRTYSGSVNQSEVLQTILVDQPSPTIITTKL
ncbi:hypothetical protein [Francisella sp. SYW-9]|uniref:hypothetical protein n=1 Tax=Francisella sp. SYW-9 TaxID=2610888 RepID=UPI00123D8910|nr:hypothetical protein [Francisella sp. SYW-9]